MQNNGWPLKPWVFCIVHWALSSGSRGLILLCYCTYNTANIWCPCEETTIQALIRTKGSHYWHTECTEKTRYCSWWVKYCTPTGQMQGNYIKRPEARAHYGNLTTVSKWTNIQVIQYIHALMANYYRNYGQVMANIHKLWECDGQYITAIMRMANI